MTIHDRIRVLIEELNMNPNSFSNALGIKSPIIHNIIGKQQSAPGYILIRKILDSFSHVSAEWLLREKGEMFLKEKKEVKELEINIELLALKRENELLRDMVNLLKQKSKL